jgi:hypothetical protein
MRAGALAGRRRRTSLRDGGTGFLGRGPAQLSQIFGIRASSGTCLSHHVPAPNPANTAAQRLPALHFTSFSSKATFPPLRSVSHEKKRAQSDNWPVLLMAEIRMSTGATHAGAVSTG